MALRTLISVVTLSAICAGPTLFVGCGSKGESPEERVEGQSDFTSAPPGGGAGNRGGAESAGTSDSSAPAPMAPGGAKVPDARKVEETDLYRLDGDRLYYLNAYRGLMVFDVTDVAKPKLLGRSPIYGQPVEMIVRGGVANVVVADWYGAMEDGSPFHGSVVRQIDARDPKNIKVTGEAKLGGWVRDTRIVGDVLYAVSEDYGWSYGWYYGGGEGDSVAGGSSGAKVMVSAVNFAGGTVKQTGKIELPGYGGIFYVNGNSIMLAHDVVVDPSKPWSEPTGKTELLYVDISDPLGSIKARGKLEVNGRAQGWGADNGRWNLDFGDQKFAHMIGCAGTWCSGSNYVLATADFTNPDAPVLASELSISGSGWTPAARFVEGRMYLSPSNGWYDSSSGKTPIQIYDTSDAKAPKLAGSTAITGNVWLFMPSGNKLFALGNEYGTSGPYYDSSKVSLRYLDVTDPAKPSVLGSSVFGDGWAWTPAAGTFKAFTKDDKQGLVVLPFSGWSSKTNSYNNGLQLIEFDATSIKTAGAAKTKGWVERGIFVKGRLVSLSDMALSVVDYSDRANPKVISELTLARNVVNAQPQGKTIAQLSSDWWDHDLTKSELRVLPIGDAEERQSLDGALASVAIEGYNARVFRNGELAYVVSDVREKVTCTTSGPKDFEGPTGDCYSSTQKIQVVDLAGGKAVLKGSVKLPTAPSGYWGWGWYGCYYWDWYNGADVLQVQGDALAFRRWYPVYSADGKYEESKHALYVVDLKDAAAPKLASTAVTTDPYGWWGNMRVAGDKLYVSHYEWLTKPDPMKPGETKYTVKYYVDPIDLSDRSAPKVGARINVPGIMVGASTTDPSILYTVDYRWYGDSTKDELAVVKIKGDKAYLQGSTIIDGYVGQVFVQGNKAYASAQRYTYAGDTYKGPRVQLHEIDITNPKAPVDRVSTEKAGWGWLLGVTGDRAVLTSGWGGSGVDIYKLSATTAPVFDQFVRTRGWWSTSLTRQDNQLFLASGYWGVQTIDLK